MKPAELKKIQDKFELGLTVKYEAQLQLQSDGVTDVTKYDKFFLRTASKYLYMLEQSDIHSGIEEMQDFVTEHSEHVCIGKSDIEQFKETYYEGTDEFEYIYSYSTIISKLTFESVTKSQKRDNLAKLLNPGTDMDRTPDCKLITLFKDGTIDWNALQKLTYTDCDL